MTFAYPAAWVHTVTRIRPGTQTDRYGNAMPDWATATELDFEGALVTPRATAGTSSAEESTETRQTDTTGFTIYLRGDADIEATDRIRWGGDTYDIEGRPAPWPSPHGDGVHNTQVVIREVVG